MKALMTEITLRTMIRGAWAVIDISKDISSAGERLEAWTEELAARSGQRMDAVLWPLMPHWGDQTGR